MFKFNGFYGCHVCTAPVKTIGKTNAYYPFKQSGEIREPVINNMYVECAEILGCDQLINAVGVKGKSAFTELIDGLPLTAPTDYMHCLLIGVFPDLLKLCFRTLSSEQKIKFNITVAILACPRKMIAYSQNIQPLDEISQFKANEFLNWLFYISPILFLNRLPVNLFSQLLNLVFGVQLLLESSCESSIVKAQQFLDKF